METKEMFEQLILFFNLKDYKTFLDKTFISKKYPCFSFLAVNKKYAISICVINYPVTEYFEILINNYSILKASRTYDKSYEIKDQIFSVLKTIDL